jgi:hypothetical protein
VTEVIIIQEDSDIEYVESSPPPALRAGRPT